MHSHFEKFKTKIKTLSLLVLAVGGIYVYLINVDITVGFLKSWNFPLSDCSAIMNQLMTKLLVSNLHYKVIMSITLFFLIA